MVLACLATLVALFYAEENFRGQRVWNKYRQEAEARGEQLDFKTFIPLPVPDDQNLAATPLVQSWFERGKPHYESWSDRENKSAGDYYGQAEINIAQARPKGGESFRRRNSSLEKGNRHFLDLVAWGTAFDAIRAGAFSKRQKIEAGKLDFESRSNAAPSVLEGLKSNETMFAELRVASQRPYCRYPIDYNVENPAAILLPHLSRIRAVCRRLQLRACAELAMDQSEAALEDVKLMFTLSDRLKEEPFLISYLVRIACLGIAIQPIWEGLAERAWSDTQLRELQTRLQQYNFVADLKRPLDAERAAGIAIIDSIRRNGGTFNQLIDPLLTNPKDAVLGHWFGGFIPRGWFYEEQFNYCRLYQVQLHGTFDPAAKRAFPARIKANDIAFDRVFSHSPADFIIHHRLVAGLLLPALGNVVRRAAMAQVMVDQVALGCALERYRLANGQFADNLDALVPAFASQLPHDVITGEPYKYRRTDDGHFILYSVGWNEKDDGGVPGQTLFEDKEGDWVWQYPPSL